METRMQSRTMIEMGEGQISRPPVAEAVRSVSIALEELGFRRIDVSIERQTNGDLVIEVAGDIIGTIATLKVGRR